MYIWHIKWTFPGWIFYPGKAHKFGNKWHTACCELSGILFVLDLVEGKYHPRQAVTLEFEDLVGKTVVLLLCEMKIYLDTGGYVIIDSGFCVLKGLI